MRFLLLVMIAVTGYAGAVEGIPEKTVNSKSLRVTLLPADNDAADAASAHLYITRFPGAGWRMVGPCQILHHEGKMHFTRDVSVDGDGNYYFTYRAANTAGNSTPPEINSVPKIRVTVDTTAPAIQLFKPTGYEKVKPGDQLTISWSAQDENLDSNSTIVEYSFDGETWHIVDDESKTSGSCRMIVPDSAGESLLARVTVRDTAGNTSRAISEKAVLIEEAPLADDDTPEEGESGGETGKPAQKSTGKKPVKRVKNDRLNPTRNRGAWIAYIMAGNLVRQGRLKDSLQYYWSAAETDSQFDEAWNDMALIYKELGAYKMAHEAINKALYIDATHPQYNHNKGEVYQAEGMVLLRKRPDPDGKALGKETINLAVKWYGKAIDYAKKEWRLAEQAPSFFRLGQICYFVNHDPVGARAYWQKVVALHTPTPDLDPVIWSKSKDERKRARKRYQQYTQMRVGLNTWRTWARGYLKQLAELESKGMVPVQPEPATWADEHNIAVKPVRSGKGAKPDNWLYPDGVEKKPDWAEKEYGNRVSRSGRNTTPPTETERWWDEEDLYDDDLYENNRYVEPHEEEAPTEEPSRVTGFEQNSYEEYR